MPGVTKRIFEHEIRDIIKMWNEEIQSIQPLLPRLYNNITILKLLQHFYPHEWKSVQSKYVYYQTKDKYLIRYTGKSRFNMPRPELLIKKSHRYRFITSNNYKKEHEILYSEEKRKIAFENLRKERAPKIAKVNNKIDLALSKLQQITPTYIDQLIGLYERKRTTQKDRMYILLELKKYYCDKIIQFFFKLNDTEINYQLRNEAFLFLQSFNFKPRLRKQQYFQIHTKNLKRRKILKDVYSKETYTIPKNPKELEYRIINSKEQKLKTYDYFISHSSKDSNEVQELIVAMNKQGKNIFCDWINDVDYLKRHLLCQATLKVIEERMKQSNALIFVKSNNSLNSVWCQYELNFFDRLKKPMLVLEKDSIKKKMFKLRTINNKWFINKDYKRIAISAGLHIK